MTNENKPFFSVVIPLYNKENYVKETIRSVVEQSFRGFEIVVVDDGSTDNSVDVVQTIDDPRIRIIRQKNAGVSVARNRGIKEAKADYIAFLDADDIWLPKFLQTIYELIQKHPEAGLYATARKLRKANSEEIGINLKSLPSKEYQGIVPDYFKSMTLGDNLVWTSATCIPKKVFIENDIWFPVGEKYGEDTHVWIRVAMQFDIAYDSKVCSVYKIETENNTVEIARKEKELPRSILILDNYRNIIKNNEKLKYYDMYIEKRRALIIRRNILNGEKVYALNQIFKHKISPINKLKLLTLIVIPKFCFDCLRKIKRRSKIVGLGLKIKGNK
ncbi:glycosyltransferase family 2 protein [Sulfurovum mangrovi]|uniref:glycosyltransferase family 2 protein n=1 Tax=Sulfurovum mangrovi TaxID=2893889 RepID=UPI001E444BB1|nr:glycosyltransferase family 2 protein [Sulfurovum mangrovi]UFH59218.1 glycosyltransferase family 2 protein [Sulfurovum mangrovi]